MYRTNVVCYFGASRECSVCAHATCVCVGERIPTPHCNEALSNEWIKQNNKRTTEKRLIGEMKETRMKRKEKKGKNQDRTREMPASEKERTRKKSQFACIFKCCTMCIILVNGKMEKSLKKKRPTK